MKNYYFSKLIVVFQDICPVWAKQVNIKCLKNLIEKCPRTYPNQLTEKEVNIIKQQIEKPENNGTSICSIAGNAIRNDLMYVSMSTWYKYIHLLGLVHSLPSHRRKNHKTGG